MTTSTSAVATPHGAVTIEVDDGAVVGIHFPREGDALRARPPGPDADPVLVEAHRQLEEYLAGHRSSFDLPLRPRGTPFQLAVWEALRSIPFGETRSYGDVARAVGRPSAVRAVGAANGRNPIPIVVPCHRVIGATGALVGFGGGLPMKRFLLALERGRELPLFEAPAPKARGARQGR